MDTDKRYPNGTVYKIWSHINDYFYIGSTFMPLRCRKSSHKNTKVEKMRQWFDDAGWENLKFDVIETYKDITKRELNKYEDDEILKHKGDDNCMNCNRAYRTGKEYYQDNRDRINEQKKKYYEENRDRIVEQRRRRYERNKNNMLEKITCSICDCEVSKTHFTRHEKTKKHKLNLQEVKSV